MTIYCKFSVVPAILLFHALTLPAGGKVFVIPFKRVLFARFYARILGAHNT